MKTAAFFVGLILALLALVTGRRGQLIFGGLAMCVFLAGAAFGQTAPVVVAGKKTVTLTATADGTQPFTYQWYRNGAAMAGETKTALVITDPKATGIYECEVSNSAGKTRTPSVRLANTAIAAAAVITVTRKSP